MADLKTTTVYGDMYVNNRVGIGTNTPAYSLVIQGSGSQATPVTLQIAGLDSTYAADARLVISQLPSMSDLILMTAGVDSRSDGLIANDQYVIAGQRLNLYSKGNGSTYNTKIELGVNTGYGDIAFYTNAASSAATERMRISGSGNIGIGTTTPASKLQVYGDFLSIQGNATDAANAFGSPSSVALGLIDSGVYGQYKGGTIGFGGASGGGTTPYLWSVIKGGKENATAGNYAGYLSMWTIASDSSTAERMRISSAGNVGIGTITPSALLHVYNGASAVGTSNGSIATGVVPTAFNGFYPIISSNNHGDFSFGINLSLDSVHQLQTWNNHATIQGSAIVMGGNSNPNGANSISFISKASGTATSGSITALSTANMVITSTGVGIGTTNTATFTLQVAGNTGPNADSTYDLGAAATKWRTLYAATITSSNIQATNLFGSASYAISASWARSSSYAYSSSYSITSSYTLTASYALSGAYDRVFIGAADFIPRTTTGCGIDSQETSVNKINRDLLTFDPATRQYAQYWFAWPVGWNTAKLTFYWFATGSSGDVVWGGSLKCYPDGEPIDVAMGITQSVTDTLATANTLRQTGTTPTITPSGSIANGGNISILEIYRDAPNSADTLAINALLQAVLMEKVS